jgi:hypothetical protein
MKQLVGVLLKDMPRYMPALAGSGKAWLTVCNRYERLVAAPDHSGYRCDWQWTSDLHAPKVIPALGRLLMKRAVADHPIRRVESPKCEVGTAPQVTFLIGHRGMPRLSHLLTTLQSVAAQQGAAVECIVIEQDTVSQLGPHLPAWVRLVHTPPPAPDMPYCRAWTFNVGAQHAQADVLVLHDNDMLVPVDYAASILDRVRQGYDVVNLKRFIFYLTKSHTQAVFDVRAGLLDAAPEVIVQNSEGGGSVAITRSSYAQIGGLDESFIGWGGEDNEFWERAQTLRVWPWANLPLVHLWHAAQPGKQAAGYHTARRYQALARVSPQQRIARLTSAPNGQMSRPQGWPAAFGNINTHGK